MTTKLLRDALDALELSTKHTDAEYATMAAIRAYLGTPVQPDAYLVEGRHNGRLIAHAPYIVLDDAKNCAATFARHYPTVNTIPLHAVPPDPEMAPLTQAMRDVLAERHRQVTVEGWTPEHDDDHGNGSMSIAAACYALANKPALEVQTVKLRDLWLWTGWAAAWFKPRDARRNLIRATALLLAEIERIDRAHIIATKGESA